MQREIEELQRWYTFRGRGGPLMLGRILRVFLDWAHQEE